jgi:4-hydroxy-tetrahydrodipicolinate synthase
MKQFEGHGVAMITPFTKKGLVDFKAIPKIIEHLFAGSVNYIVVLGTTAETSTLSKVEKKQILEKTIEANAGRIPLVLGLGGNNTNEIIEELKSNNLNGFSAILSVSPYYNKPNQEGLYQHFRAISLASTLPIILYNVPARTGINLKVETVVRLAHDFDNIIALKEASGDFQQAQSLIKSVPSGFLILSGDDEISLPMILAGAKGVISVIGNAIPSEFSKIIHSAIEGDSKLAYTNQYLIIDLIRMIYLEGNPVGIKVLMKNLKLCENSLRLPLVKASKGLIKKLNHEFSLLN